MGKRGGARVIYYFRDPSMPLFLLTMYAKGRRDDLSPEELKAAKKIVVQLRENYARR